MFKKNRLFECLNILAPLAALPLLAVVVSTFLNQKADVISNSQVVKENVSIEGKIPEEKQALTQVSANLSQEKSGEVKENSSFYGFRTIIPVSDKKIYSSFIIFEECESVRTLVLGKCGKATECFSDPKRDFQMYSFLHETVSTNIETYSGLDLESCSKVSKMFERQGRKITKCSLLDIQVSVQEVDIKDPYIKKGQEWAKQEINARNNLKGKPIPAE